MPDASGLVAQQHTCMTRILKSCGIGPSHSKSSRATGRAKIGTGASHPKATARPIFLHGLGRTNPFLVRSAEAADPVW